MGEESDERENNQEGKKNMDMDADQEESKEPGAKGSDNDWSDD